MSNTLCVRSLGVIDGGNASLLMSCCSTDSNDTVVVVFFFSLSSFNRISLSDGWNTACVDSRPSCSLFNWPLVVWMESERFLTINVRSKSGHVGKWLFLIALRKFDLTGLKCVA